MQGVWFGFSISLGLYKFASLNSGSVFFFSCLLLEVAFWTMLNEKISFWDTYI